MAKQVRKKNTKKIAAINRSRVSVEIVLCTDLEKLSFARFLKCLTSDNYSALVDKGLPNKLQLFHAWIKVLSEFYVLTNNIEQLKYVKLVAKMEAYNLKINVIENLCESLWLWYNMKLGECLKKWGYKMQFTPETYLADIDRVLILLGNDKFQYEKLRINYASSQKQKRKSGGEESGKKAYMKSLYAIESHRKIQYDPETLSVYKYALLYNELVEYNEMMQTEQEKLKNKTPRKKTKK